MPGLFYEQFTPTTQAKCTLHFQFSVEHLVNFVTSVRDFFFPFWASVSHLTKESKDNTGWLQGSDEKMWTKAFETYETLEYLNNI